MGKTLKNLLLLNHKTQSFHILCVAMYSGPLYKCCQPCPWGPYGLRPGGVMGKTLKNLLLRNHKAQSFHILSVAMYSGPLYKSCQPCPWGPYGPRPGSVMGKTLKNLLLRNHMAQSFHMLCGPMYNTLLYKCCQRCPWGPYRPRPRHVIIYHRLIMEIYEKIFTATAWHKACIFDIQHCHVELYINPANLAPGVNMAPPRVSL